LCHDYRRVQSTEWKSGNHGSRTPHFRKSTVDCFTCTCRYSRVRDVSKRSYVKPSFTMVNGRRLSGQRFLGSPLMWSLRNKNAYNLRDFVRRLNISHFTERSIFYSSTTMQNKSFFSLCFTILLSKSTLTT
jgi:hypothetical protein